MKRFALHAIVLFTIAACHESTQPAAPADRPAFGTMASLACPASPTFTVSDEASLRAALAAASPGAVIAIRGMIGIAADVFVTTPNVTLTCAAAGAGLFALISNNTFTSAGSFTGVHVQLGLEDLDSVRIEGNTIVATAPSTDFRFGGIRLVGARHAVIRDNIVTGPWANSLSLATLSTSLI